MDEVAYAAIVGFEQLLIVNGGFVCWFEFYWGAQWRDGGVRNDRLDCRQKPFGGFWNVSDNLFSEKKLFCENLILDRRERRQLVVRCLRQCFVH